MQIKITYRGNDYTRKDTGYYQSTKKVGKSRLWLHREVYKEEVGSIPDGYHIHHKDHNKDNNTSSNLECLSNSEHQKEHTITNTHLKDNQDEMQRLSRLAKEGKYVGRDKLRKLMKGKKHTTCVYCSKDFTLKDTDRDDTKFCSSVCRDKYHRKAKNPKYKELTQIRCKECNEEFRQESHNQRYCSTECSKIGKEKDRKLKVYTKECNTCKKQFTGHSNKTKYCSRECMLIGRKANRGSK